LQFLRQIATIFCFITFWWV